MVALHAFGHSDNQIAQFYDRPHQTVGRIIHKWEQWAEPNSKPLRDITNVQNTPGKRGRRRVFTDDQELDIKEYMYENRLKRRKTERQWIDELELPCSELTFQKLMYKYHSYYLLGGQKPELNDGC